MKTKMAVALLFLFALTMPTAFADDGALAGVYVGGHLGVANASMTNEDSDCFWNCSAYTQRDSGLGLGIQAGQNFTSGKLLFGYFVDYTKAFGVDKDFTYAGEAMKASSKFKSAFSLRAKVGALVDDATAISFSFGPARGKFESSFLALDNICCGAAGSYSKQDGNTSGWVYGVGIDHAFLKNLLVSFDWSHYVFQDKTGTWHHPDGTPDYYSGTFPYYAKYSNTVDIARVTVSYKF